ncbi:MAG: hypothetical protein AB7T01_11065 [Acidithiobacillus sp.]
MATTAFNKPSNTSLAVHYRGGLTLTYLFERTTKVVDLMAVIRRAGQVRKVILWDELPDDRKQRKAAM